jgi:hypothetical protein
MVFMMGNVIKLFLVLSSSSLLISAEPVYVHYAHEIMDSFAEEMHQEFGLVCTGKGGAMARGDVEEMALSFIAYREASVREAGDLEVMVTERFLQKINQDERIKPFLHTHPFKADRAEVSISFESPDGHPQRRGVSYVSQYRNKIHYRKKNPLKKGLENLGDQPYEEAKNN